MGTIVKPYTFTASTAAVASEVNSNFDTIYAEFNGSISDTNLANSAVTENKIATGAVTNGKLGANAVTSTKVANNAVYTAAIQDDAVTQPKIGPGAVGSTELASGAVLNDRVAAGAGIAFSKMAALTASKLLVSDASGVVTPTLGNIRDMYVFSFATTSGGSTTYYVNPASWTVTRISAGVFDVVHNLATANLVYLTTIGQDYDSQALIVYSNESDSNTCRIRVMNPNTTVGLDNYRVNLMVIRHS